MKSFVAQILFRVEDERYSADRYEVQCRLVLAQDEHAALSSARRLGQAEEASLTDVAGRLMRRSLVGVKDLREFSADHGALLFSEVQEMEPLTFPNLNEATPVKKVYLS
jgi:hypothetical protein